MNNNVIEILKNVQQGNINPKDICPKERQNCVGYLRLDGYKLDEIAEIFGVSTRTIIRDEKEVKKEYSKIVNDLDLKAIAGDLIVTANRLYSKAVKDEDYSLAWKIKCELITKLQNLGYLPKASEKIDLQVNTFTDLIKMIEIQDKDNVKKIHSKVIESNPDIGPEIMSQSF